MTASEIVASARRCVGTRFRLQGRDRDTGLDCVGVAGVALGAALPPASYAQRSREIYAYAVLAEELGLREIFPGEARPGDLVVYAPGPGQLHTVIITPGGYVHADARLRKVVETPGTPPWPVVVAWRGCADNEG
jgi:lipoprotein Spr